MSFKLSGNLLGHSQDVKSISSLPTSSNHCLSGSRDSTAIIWQDKQISTTLKTHSKFVNAVASCQPCQKYPNGAFATAGTDKVIYVYDVNAPLDPIFTLIGHEDNVCDLKFGSKGDVYSASWDKTAKIWNNGQCIYTLNGHAYAVWAVLPVSDNIILTASADKTIKKWENGKCIQTITGHTDVVRGLALLPNIGFLSCSNDASLRIWSLDGTCVQELHGHTSFVYQVAVSPAGEIASCGEDRSLRVWKDGQCVQTIMHPCTSVWTVAWLSDTEVATGSSDGAVRIFSKDPSKYESGDAIASYEDAVASYAMASQQVGAIDPSKLGQPSDLSQPGKKDQEVKMIKNGGSIDAYQWSQADGEWIQIGQVVDAIGSSRKQVFEGKEYDYVFDIDIQEGAPPLKLPYNVTENPWSVAQDFIYKYELPQDYLDQIGNFIVKNTQAHEIQQTVQTNVDPFTGAGRYVPAAASAPTTSNYHAQKKINSSPSILPLKEYNFFKIANYLAIDKKLKELNSSMEVAGLTLVQLAALSDSLSCMESSKSLPIDIFDAFVQAVKRILVEWPDKCKFPGLDIYRLALANNTVDFKILWDKEFESLIFQQAASDNLVNATFAFRILCNLFSTSEAETWIQSQSQTILITAASKSMSNLTNKNLRQAYVTLLSNFVLLFGKNNSQAYHAQNLDIMNLLSEFIKTETDIENMYRAVVSFGSLLFYNEKIKNSSASIDSLISLNSLPLIQDAKIKPVVQEIESMLNLY